VANAADESFERIVFVDVSPIADPQLIAGAIARAIGIEFDLQGDSIESLLAALPSQPLLIVLDNCEHLVDACARLAGELVQKCAHVRVLATSREPLGIAAEAVYRLGPLEAGAAHELFTAHAHQVDPQFAPVAKDLPVLHEICRHLDGIALAIQLAASHVNAMSLGQLRSRLDGHFPLLIAGGGTGEPSRHKTVEALIDWSHDVLSPRERAVFRRLGAFTDRFTLEAACSVAAGDAPGLTDVARVVEALVEKSMIVRTGDRYRMLEAVRQYALERLLERREERDARRAIAAYYANHTRTLAQRFGFGSQDEWFGSLVPDLENFRAAIAWARDLDVRLASELAANLLDFWEFASLAAEGLRRSEAILAAMEHPDEPEALPILLAIARLAGVTHVYWRSLEIAERARVLAERSNDRSTLAELRRIGARARRILGVETHRCVPDLREALAVIRSEENPYRTARAVADYALALIDDGRDDLGREVLHEADELTRSLDWPHLFASVQINVAEWEFRSGNVSTAIERGCAIVALMRPRGTTTQLALALSNLAGYLSVFGRFDDAYAVAEEAVRTAVVRDLHFSIAWALQSVAIVIASRGDDVRAAQLLGYTDAYCENTVSKREPAELIVQQHLLGLLNAALDAETLEQALAAGRRLLESAAIELAFGTADGL
jgi:predicted ATPase